MIILNFKKLMKVKNDVGKLWSGGTFVPLRSFLLHGFLWFQVLGDRAVQREKDYIPQIHRSTPALRQSCGQSYLWEHSPLKKRQSVIQKPLPVKPHRCSEFAQRWFWYFNYSDSVLRALLFRSHVFPVVFPLLPRFEEQCVSSLFLFAEASYSAQVLH